MKITAYDIEYETDGQPVDLPKTINFEVDKNFNIVEELADKVSDETGFLVKSLKYKI